VPFAGKQPRETSKGHEANAMRQTKTGKKKARSLQAKASLHFNKGEDTTRTDSKKKKKEEEERFLVASGGVREKGKTVM